MEGSVRKRGDHWYYYFSYVDELGKRKKVERKVGADKGEAQKALRRAITEFERGFVADAHERVKGYLEDWLEYIKENRKINTYNRYKGIVNNSIIPVIGEVKLKDLKSTHIEKVLSMDKKKNVSSTTLEGVYLVCNAAFGRAWKKRLIGENPCTFVEKPKRGKYVGTALKIEDIDKLLAATDTSQDNGYIMYLALTLILELGLRRGEVTGLTWDDVDLAGNTVTIQHNVVYSHGHTYMTTPKTDAGQRTLYISDQIVKVLKAHKKKQIENKLFYGMHYATNTFDEQPYNFILTWPNGKYVHPNYYTTRFKTLIKKAGLDEKIRFHDLRHTNATLMLEQGVDFKTLQIRLGHADISTTMDIYSHVNLEMQKKAVQKLSKALE